MINEGGGAGSLRERWWWADMINIRLFKCTELSGSKKRKYFERSRYKIPKEYQVGVGVLASEFICDLLNLR